mmetsp:Transcript_54738/g.102578  ORF Transcript_54738/g.102578 Transcript_54738/m.102578 type:complete len:91 (+) Transcript_54738:606-878(+)
MLFEKTARKKRDQLDVQVQEQATSLCGGVHKPDRLQRKAKELKDAELKTTPPLHGLGAAVMCILRGGFENKPSSDWQPRRKADHGDAKTK